MVDSDAGRSYEKRRKWWGRNSPTLLLSDNDFLLGDHLSRSNPMRVTLEEGPVDDVEDDEGEGEGHCQRQVVKLVRVVVIDATHLFIFCSVGGYQQYGTVLLFFLL